MSFILEVFIHRPNPSDRACSIHAALSTPSPSGSRLQPLLGRVRAADLVHHDEGVEGTAGRGQVPGVLPRRPGEPGRAEAEEQAAAAQQVSDQPGGGVVAFELGQGPALRQGVVDQRHGRQRLQRHCAHGDHAQQAVPRGEVGLAAEVLVVNDGRQAQDGTGHAEALQDPVCAGFRLVWKRF